MKILIIDVYHFIKGGVETVAFNSQKLLEQQGHDVIYFALKWKDNIGGEWEKYYPESKQTRKGIFAPFINLKNYFYNSEAACSLQELIDVEKPDIAHVHTFWGQLSPSVLKVLKKNNIKIIHSVHEYRMVCPAYCFRNNKGKICEECQGRKFYCCFKNKCSKGNYMLSAIMTAEMYFRMFFFPPHNYFDGIIYVSNFCHDIHEKYYPALSQIEKVTIYNSTDLVPTCREQPTEKYYLYYGRLSFEKGVKTLLDVFSDFKDIKLKIIGTGPIEEDLKSYKEKNQLANIEFLGYKTGKELYTFIENAYFVIVPSEWYENNPLTIIESYALGVPVIGAKIGGIPEIIDHGITGYLYEYKKKENLKRMIDTAENLDTQSYKIMKENTLAYAKKNFSPVFYYKKLMDFYKKILNKEESN